MDIPMILLIVLSMLRVQAGSSQMYDNKDAALDFSTTSSSFPDNMEDRPSEEKSTSILPIDVIRQIASHLKAPSRELSHLALLNKSTFLTLSPLLYRHVIITSKDQATHDTGLIFHKVFPGNNKDNDNQITGISSEDQREETVKEHLFKHTERFTFRSLQRDPRHFNADSDFLVTENDYKRIKPPKLPSLDICEFELNKRSPERYYTAAFNARTTWRTIKKLIPKRIIIRNAGFYMRNNLHDHLTEKKFFSKAQEVIVIVNEDTCQRDPERDENFGLTGLLNTLLYLEPPCSITFVLSTSPDSRFKTHSRVNPNGNMMMTMEFNPDYAPGWLNGWTSNIAHVLKVHTKKIRFVGFGRLDGVELGMVNGTEKEIQGRVQKGLKIRYRQAMLRSGFHLEDVVERLEDIEMMEMKEWLDKGYAYALDEDVAEAWSTI